MTSTIMEAAANGGMTFARFFPSDWRTGCLVLNLEEEGLYIRVCMFHYDTGKALPDDYAKCAQLLRVQRQKLAKVMDSLIAKGKIIRAQGILFNERVQEEIDRYRDEHLARALAAKKRELAKKAKLEEIMRELEEHAAKKAATPGQPPTQPPQTPPHQPPYQPHPGEHGGDAEKRNEINETQAQGAVYQNLEARNQKPERKNIGGVGETQVAPPKEDFGFDGERVSFSHEDVLSYRLDFPELEFPRDLRSIEKTVDYRTSHTASRGEFIDELRKALGARALKLRALKAQAERVVEAKDEGHASASCYIRNGRIFVANGFEADLLKEFADGDSTVLREALDKAGQYVPFKAKGEGLMLAVRSQLTKQRQWAQEDKQKPKRGMVPDSVPNMLDMARAAIEAKGGRA